MRGLARLRDGIVSASAVQRLLHRRMGPCQQMRWSSRGAYMILKIRTVVANGAFDQDCR